MNIYPKLSQIIIYVDEAAPIHDICAFCTKVNNEHPEILLTYINYVNYKQEIMSCISKLLDKIEVSIDRLMIITDITEIMDYAGREGIAVAGFAYKGLKREIPYSVNYCVENIAELDYSRVNKIWQRFRGIPWEIVRTNRITIREHIAEDIIRIKEMYSDEEVSKYMQPLSDENIINEEYLNTYIKHQYGFYEFGTWAVIENETSKLIGRVGFNLRDGYDELELGYVIDADYRNKGYATEACKAALQYAKDELEVSEIIAFVHKENVKSLNLLKKLGFSKREGCEMGRIKCDFMIKYFDTM